MVRWLIMYHGSMRTHRSTEPGKKKREGRGGKGCGVGGVEKTKEGGKEKGKEGGRREEGERERGMEKGGKGE